MSVRRKHGTERSAECGLSAQVRVARYSEQRVNHLTTTFTLQLNGGGGGGRAPPVTDPAAKSAAAAAYPASSGPATRFVPDLSCDEANGFGLGWGARPVLDAQVEAYPPPPGAAMDDELKMLRSVSEPLLCCERNRVSCNQSKLQVCLI